MLLYDPGAIFLVLALALALDAVLGEWPFARDAHPIALLGRAIAALEQWLNRSASRPVRLRLAGGLAVAIVVAAMIVAGLALAWLLRAVPVVWLLEAVAVAVLLAQRSLFDHVRAVATALDRDGLDAGREAVSHIVGRDPATLDGHGVARAAIESLAENFSDGVVAPVFWYLLLGLPGIAAYKAVNTLDSMIGHKSPRYLHFGMVAARLDDALNFVPARLSGVLLALGGIGVRNASPRQAFAAMAADAGKHRSPNAGWPEAATAGALDLKLAGPRVYKDETVDAPFIGPGTPNATPRDIYRALAVYLMACVLQGGIVLVVAFALH